MSDLERRRPEPPPLLNQSQVEAALKYLVGAFPRSTTMSDEQREAWVDVLVRLRPGELKGALAARSDNQRYRPDPYVVLDLVLKAREGSTSSSRAEGRLEATRQRLDDQRGFAPPRAFDVSAFCDQIRAEAKLPPRRVAK